MGLDRYARRVMLLFASLAVSLAASVGAGARPLADPYRIFPDRPVAVLAEAVAEGDVDAVHRLADAGNVNGAGDRGVTILEWALLHRRPNMLGELLDRGADATRPCSGRDTVIHLAAMATDPAYLKVLLAHGADPNAPSQRTGEPPLSAALMNPDRTAFRMLIDAPADVNRADAMGNTPLHVAAQVGDSAAILSLLQAGADPTRRNRRGDTFQPYFNMLPANVQSEAGRARHEAVRAWLRSHGVTVEPVNR